MTKRTDRHLRVGVCLSLSGRFARFGLQAAHGLEVWRALQKEGAVELIVEDDRSDLHTLQATLPGLMVSCDLVLGPYSTQLMRTAGRIAADTDRLIWNHGGSGDDVETGFPGHVVSVLTPTSRYAEPFVRRLADEGTGGHLWIVHGKGSFGRQVAAGAELTARKLGIAATRIGPDDELPAAQPSWDLLCAGLFEEDVQTVTTARQLPSPPRTICAVAAGVSEFGQAVDTPEGIFGMGQWVPHSGTTAELGLTEDDFLATYTRRTGRLPDYPAAQAAAGAVLATHCARIAGSTGRQSLWSAAAALDTRTLFGRFKIDPGSGVQVGHEPALVRWTDHGPVRM